MIGPTAPAAPCPSPPPPRTPPAHDGSNRRDDAVPPLPPQVALSQPAPRPLPALQIPQARRADVTTVHPRVGDLSGGRSAAVAAERSWLASGRWWGGGDGA